MSTALKELALLRLSSELQELRRLVEVDGLKGVAYQIDLAAHEAAIAARQNITPLVSADPKDPKVFTVLSNLRRLKSRAEAMGQRPLAMLIGKAIDEANSARRALKKE